MRLWEFDNRDADGNPVETSRRVPWSRQLDAGRDAGIIESHRDPAYVLGGWTPPQAGE